MSELREKFRTLRSHPYPLRLLAWRMFSRSGLPFLTIRRSGYSVRLFPTAICGALWLDPSQGVPEETTLCSLLPRGGVFVDVGANIGSLCLAAAAAVGSEGQVFAFEPSARTMTYLRKNVNLNGFRNVVLVQSAVGAETREAHMAESGQDDMNHISISGRGSPIRMTTLDDALEPYGLRQIDVLKIDAEGYEKFIVEGARRTLSITRMVQFEVCLPFLARYAVALQELFDLFQSAGFGVMRLVDGKFVPALATENGWKGAENFFAIKA